MRRLITGAGIVVLLLGSGCRVKKELKQDSSFAAQRTEQAESAMQVSRMMETEYLGDILSGRVPLPYTVPRSASYQVEAGGIILDVTIEDSTLTYRAEAKPVARSTLIQEDSTASQSNSSSEYLAEESREETKKSTGLPWWIWPIILIVIALAILIKLQKIKF